jgi:activator of Hsp90 ATPase-like protein
MSTAEALAPIRKSVRAEASVETAFETFTRGMGDWWPTGSHRVFEGGSAVVFEERVGGRVYERAPDGEEADWADVIEWDPPRRFVLRWRVNPKRGPTELDVRFTPEGNGTIVELEHRGWDDADGRANYYTGWDPVLEHYAASVQSVNE